LGMSIGSLEITMIYDYTTDGNPHEMEGGGQGHQDNRGWGRG
jgi:hypothetical protein